MRKLVIDSSVIVKWLNQQDEELLDQADAILQDVQDGKVALLAPELAKYEVGNALLVHKRLSVPEAQISMDVLFSLPMQFVVQSPVLSRHTYKEAHRNNITYYDATFIAVAQQEGAVLVTDNFKHQGKIKAIEVMALKEYSS